MNSALAVPDGLLESAIPAPVDKARPVDQPRIERAVREILLAIGEDPDRDGLHRHPGPGGPDVRRAVRWAAAAAARTC